jgi:hypothetical protein
MVGILFRKLAGLVFQREVEVKLRGVAVLFEEPFGGLPGALTGETPVIVSLQVLSENCSLASPGA